MAKKPRSQRRKKGKSLGDQDGDGDSDAGAADFLPEDHTVADSSVNSGSAVMDEDFSDFDDVVAGQPSDDYLLLHGANGPHSSDAAVAAVQARLVKLRDTLANLNELPAEKRSVKREAVLKQTFRAITQYATGPVGQETVLEQQDAIFKAAWYSIRSGQPAEQYAACRVLESASVVMGANQDDWCEQLDRPCRLVLKTVSRAVPVRCAALRTLAMTTFISSADLEMTEAVLDLCQQVASGDYRNEETPVALRGTALDCWALLATTVPDFRLAGQDDVQMGRGIQILALLKNCLDTTNANLRSAAGECFALIHEARLNLGIAQEEAENSTARRFRRGSWDGSEWEVLMDEVKQRIAELSVESGKHLSKKAKKQQRATFREFMGTIVEDEAPEEVINFRNGNLTLKSWREIIQLNFVRHCLQGGFQVQLTTNETLQIIFGADGQSLNDFGGMSQIEKRLLLSKTSEAAKNKDVKLTKQRDKRQNIKNDFLTADGEDMYG
jgi:hypothetical protein